MTPTPAALVAEPRTPAEPAVVPAEVPSTPMASAVPVTAPAEPKMPMFVPEAPVSVDWPEMTVTLLALFIAETCVLLTETPPMVAPFTVEIPVSAPFVMVTPLMVEAAVLEPVETAFEKLPVVAHTLLNVLLEEPMFNEPLVVVEIPAEPFK